MSERSSIVTPLREQLEAIGCKVFRMNSGSPRRRMRGHKKGTLDLLVVATKHGPFKVFEPASGTFAPYRLAAIEAKGSHKDNCSCDSCAAQREEIKDLTARGVLCLKVRSVGEALAGLGLVGAPPFLPSALPKPSQALP